MKHSFFKSFLLTILLSFTFACTTLVVERDPAENTNSLFDQVFTFSRGEQAAKGGEDLKKFAEAQLAMHINNANPNRRFEFIVSKTMSADHPFKVELDVDQKKSEYVIRIHYHPSAFKDKTSTYSMLDFTKSILEGQNTSSAHFYFEMYFNAKNGDPVAMKNFVKMKDQATQYLADDSTTVMSHPEFVKRRALNDKLIKELDQEIKDLKSWQKQENEKRKAPLAALDKASEDKQFRTLIAKNDRKGAAKILKTYLPWEAMAPFEKQFWETYLEVIANPVPLSERVYIYRGLEGDFIHSGFSNGSALTQKDAILKDNAFVMSSMMVKNQGSWNRRLRSMEAMYNKQIATLNGEDELAQSARLTTIFQNHANVPLGSPFISFSPNYAVADSFGSGRVSAYLIDPRLLHYNFASSITSEIEFLVALTIFPDDLVAICDDQLHGFNGYSDLGRKTFLDEKLTKKIEAVYGKNKSEAILKKIQKNSYDFFNKKFENTVMPKVPGASPGTSNKKFYQSLGKDTFKPDLNPKGELNCKDIIQLFWINN